MQESRALTMYRPWRGSLANIRHSHGLRRGLRLFRAFRRSSERDLSKSLQLPAMTIVGCERVPHDGEAGNCGRFRAKDAATE